MKKMLIMCAMVAAAMGAWADEWTDPSTGITWTYTRSSGEATVESVSPAVGDLVIPSIIDEYPTTGIGSNVFNNGCCDLTSVMIPSGVVRIEATSFDRVALESIIVDGGNLSYSSVDGILFNKDQTTLVRCPTSRFGFVSPAAVTHYRVPDGVMKIGDHAFFSCFQLTGVTLPKGLVVIGEYAFRDCIHLHAMNVPDGVERIGRRAFEDTVIESVVLPDTLSFIGDQAFRVCCKLSEIEIPYSITRIEDYTFTFCNMLASISISPNVKSIGDDVFYGCDSLRQIHVAKGDANRVRMLIKESGFDTQGLTFIEDYEPEPGPVPPGPEPEPEEGFEEAHTFNGLAYAGEVMCGIVQVTTGKRTAKDQVKVGGFVMLTDGKKQTIKSVTEDIEGGKVYVETKAGKLGEMELEITDNGFTGSVGLMTVKSGDIGEDTGIISGTLKMSYFDAKTNKLKTRSIKLGGVASGGEAAGTLDTKGEDTKLFEAAIE